MSSLTPFCPRCGGNMERLTDLFGDYDDCINCGYHLDIFIPGPPIALKPLEGETASKKAQRASRGPSMGGQAL